MNSISAGLLLLAATATVAGGQDYSTTGGGTDAIVVVTSTNSIAAASTNAVRSLSLADCIDLALKHNFDIQVQRYTPLLSEYALNASYGGWDPTLKASGTHSFSVTGGGLDQNQRPIPSDTSDQNSFNSSLGGVLPWGLGYSLGGNLSEQYGHLSVSTNGFDSSASDVSLQLSQPLLKNFWTDSTREAIYLDRNKLKYSEQSLRSQLITSITAVENAYYELIFAQENVTVQQEALNLATQQLSDDKRRVQIQVLAERGGTLEQDQSQVAQNQANLINAQYTLENDENILKNLITDDYNQWHSVDIQPADPMEAVRQLFDVQDSWNLGLSLRPDLMQAKLNLENQGMVLKFDRNQLFPSLDLVGSYGFNGQGREFSGALGQVNEGTQPFYTYGAQLSMPLSNVGARNALKSDKVTSKQLLLQLKQLEQNIMVQIDDAVKQAQSSWESLDATRQARIYAEVALSAEQGKYAAGKSTTFTVLQLQNNVTSARSQEIRALANYNEALTALAQQEGSTLRHRNIEIEAK